MQLARRGALFAVGLGRFNKLLLILIELCGTPGDVFDHSFPARRSARNRQPSESNDLNRDREGMEYLQ